MVQHAVSRMRARSHEANKSQVVERAKELCQTREHVCNEALYGDAWKAARREMLCEVAVICSQASNDLESVVDALSSPPVGSHESTQMQVTASQLAFARVKVRVIFLSSKLNWPAMCFLGILANSLYFCQTASDATAGEQQAANYCRHQGRSRREHQPQRRMEEGVGRDKEGSV